MVCLAATQSDHAQAYLAQLCQMHTGIARALDVLAHTFNTLPLRDEETPLANHVFTELRAAIEDLGGLLTAAQHEKFEAADAARRRFVAQMHWAVAPPAAPAWRPPLRATSFAGTRPSLPAGTRKLGRNAPCWCGRGKKYKKCHLPLESREREHMDGLCTSARDHHAMLLCGGILVVVGQPTAGGRPASRWLPPWTKAKNRWMNTGAQDWTMSDAAREIPVLTK